MKVKMDFFRRSITFQSKLITSIFIFFVALVIGLIISNGLFLPHQILILASCFLFLIMVFNKPDIVAFSVLILMFIPLSLGSIFQIKFRWVVEPLIIILILCNILKKRGYRHKNYVLHGKNPFLIPIVLYFTVFFLNYIRNPVPATTLLGLPPEMGGFRYYYENFLLMMLFFTFADLSVSESNFIKRVMNVLFWTLSIITVVGLLILFVKPIESLIAQLQRNGIFSTRAMATGCWGKDIDVRTGAFHSLLLGSVTPLGILLLVSGAVKIKKICKLILFLMFAFGLIFSGVRSFFFGTVAALIFLTFQQRNKQLFFLMIIGGMLAYVFFNYASSLPQFQRLFWIKGGLTQISPSRAPLYSIYWETIKKHPIFGIGFATTMIDVERGAAEYSMLSTLRFGNHGFFLGTLYARGLAGLIPFLWIIGIGICKAWRLLSIKDGDSYKPIAFFCLSYLIYSIIPFIFGGVATYYSFFLVIGILSGLHMKYGVQKRNIH